jgi:hypothetical protein
MAKLADDKLTEVERARIQWEEELRVRSLEHLTVQLEKAEKESEERKEARERAVQENRACGVTALGYVDSGTIKLEHCNEMNIPINCFMHRPDEQTTKWSWSASNYMPRKEYLQGSYEIEADSKEQIMNAINRYVVPLYEAALANLKTTGKNYFWEKTEDEAEK